MKKFSRILTLLLALALVSCGGEGTTSNDTTTADAGSNDTTTEPIKEPTAWEKLESHDYKEHEFKILGYQWAALTKWMTADEETGDTFSDAVYARDRAVEELYNVKISTDLSMDGNTARNTFVNSASAGESEYDATFQWAMYMPAVVGSGALANMYDIDAIDTSAPWWSQQTVEAFEIVDGKLYYAANAMVGNNVDGGGGLFFNSRLIDEYKLDNPYELVRSGKWTLDKMYEMMTKVASNLDGQDTRSVGDMYGITSAWGQIGQFYYATDCKLSEFDANGKLVPAFATERAIGVAQWIAKVLNDPAMTANMLSDEWAYDAFYTGHSLFYSSGIGQMNTFRTEMEDNFGIIPCPKYDEAQENYYVSGTGRNGPMLGISALSDDLERSGKVIEAMAIYSYENLIDKYIDVTLVGKCARDEDTEEMLRLIIDNITCDLGFYTIPMLFDKWYPAIEAGGEQMVSTSDSIKSAVSTEFDSYINTIKELS